MNAPESHRSRRVFATLLILRMFFDQRMIRRCWPASCGGEEDENRQDTHSLTGKPIQQLEGSIDDQA